MKTQLKLTTLSLVWQKEEELFFSHINTINKLLNLNLFKVLDEQAKYKIKRETKKKAEPKCQYEIVLSEL